MPGVMLLDASEFPDHHRRGPRQQKQPNDDVPENAEIQPGHEIKEPSVHPPPY